MTAQKPEKHLKTLRPRKGALEGIIPPEAEDVFRRSRPERCWIEDGRIMLVESSWFDVAPLKDPKLFLSFVQLGVYGGEYKVPSEARIGRWVERYGLPAKRLPKRGTREAPASMTVERFRREFRDAWELWTIHKVIWAEEAGEIKRRLREPSSRWDRELVEGFGSFDHVLTRSIVQMLHEPAENAVLSTADRVLFDIASAQTADLRIRVSASGLTYWCPDLLSALYLQFGLLIVGDRPKRICENCGTLFPLRRMDSRYCRESCYRTAYNHAKADTT